jgi:hypothetical protein
LDHHRVDANDDRKEADKHAEDHSSGYFPHLEVRTK